MQNLWNAVAYIAADPALLTALRNASTSGGAPFVKIQRAPADVRQQPTPTALKGIGQILRAEPYNLRLGLYELAEINRLIHAEGIDAKLQEYKDAMELSGQTPAMHREISGAVLFDKSFRLSIAGSSTPGDLLREQGFQVSDAEAASLKTRLNNATNPADAVFRLLWSGSLCYPAVAMYDLYSHPNR